jgi:hypothetical protein
MRRGEKEKRHMRRERTLSHFHDVWNDMMIPGLGMYGGEAYRK